VSRLYTALPIEFLIWHKTSGGDYEMLAGNIASFIIGGLIAFIASVVVWQPFFLNVQVVLNDFFLKWPEDFDWSITRKLNAPVHSKTASSSSYEVHEEKDNEKDLDITVEPVAVSSARQTEEDELDPVALHKAYVFASTSSLILVSI
jgi:hypothetical protein